MKNLFSVLQIHNQLLKLHLQLMFNKYHKLNMYQLKNLFHIFTLQNHFFFPEIVPFSINGKELLHYFKSKALTASFIPLYHHSTTILYWINFVIYSELDYFSSFLLLIHLYNLSAELLQYLLSLISPLLSTHSSVFSKS